MRFQVPQFIEVEDKIFGPLTLKQFIYLAGGAGLSIMFYLFLPLFIAILFILPTIGLALALAFYKVNNKPFVNFLESAFTYALHPKLYIWQQEPPKIVTQNKKEPQQLDNSFFIPKLSNSKLKDLTWSLDAKGPIPSSESTPQE